MAATLNQAQTAESDVKSWTRAQKLAALLIILGPDSAAEVLRGLDERDMAAVASAMTELPVIDQKLHREILREFSDVFHVFLYAPRAEKIRRIMAEHHDRDEAEELVDSIDRERIAYVKHYFNADWPTRSLYHVMLNTAVGNEAVIQTILNTMRTVAHSPKATDYEEPKTPMIVR